MIYLDTHVAVWLYDGELERLPRLAKELLEEHALRVSPMVVLELRYLYETDRITVDAPAIVEYLESAVGMRVCAIPFNRVVVEGLSIDWTRDPFDRLIIAQARAAQSRLLTKDRTIRSNVDFAVWD